MATQTMLARPSRPPLFHKPMGFRTKVEIEYPESDGQPMAETDWHRKTMTDNLIYPLKKHYQIFKAGTYVSGNLLIYYEKGNNKESVAPDAFVVFGIGNHERRQYKVWEEGKVPDIVFELTSKSTYKKDVGEKRWLYERLGVPEYIILDPGCKHMEQPLLGFTLQQGPFYIPMPVTRLANGNWQIESKVLGLRIETSRSEVLLYDPLQQRYLLTPDEEAEGRQKAEEAHREALKQVQEEAVARRKAEEERHKAEEERRAAFMQAESEGVARRKAEEERRAAFMQAESEGVARRKAEEERHKAEMLAAVLAEELARLRALLTPPDNKT